MSRIDRIAILLCFCSLIANAFIADPVFDNIPHLEDEYALVWQAQAAALGQVLIPSPPSPESFLVPFVVDEGGYRFGKYPLGFPVLLSFGLRLGVRDWVNPFIAACSLWLIYLLAKKLLDERTALIAAFLTATSPFFLINSANLLTHAWSLFLSVSLALAWLDTFHSSSKIPGWLTAAVAGGSLGVLALTRPWTAVGVALPFALDGLVLLWKGRPAARFRVLAVGATASLIAVIHLLWQYVLTGSPWINPYTLWWPFDAIGLGPGIGIRPGGHTLLAGFSDAFFSLTSGANDLFGWLWLSWLFLPLGLLAVRRSRAAWLIVSVFPSLVLAYLFYWVGAWIFGPRYYYEGMYSLTILSAAGISWTARQLFHSHGPPIRKLSAFCFVLLLALLLTGNLVFYLPTRLGGLWGLYGADRSLLDNFQTTQAIARPPALIIVHADKNWREYAALLQYSDPLLKSPYIFALSLDEKTDQKLAGYFPDRQVFHYYPEKPDWNSSGTTR